MGIFYKNILVTSCWFQSIGRPILFLGGKVLFNISDSIVIPKTFSSWWFNSFEKYAGQIGSFPWLSSAKIFEHQIEHFIHPPSKFKRHAQLSREKNHLTFHLYWWFNRDPYNGPL